VLDECASFFSSADVFEFSEEFLVHGYAYVVFHACKPRIFGIFSILKSFISFTIQYQHEAKT
jgi:hypothetical protein